MWDGRRERKERLVDDLMEVVMLYNIKITLEKKKKIYFGVENRLYRKHSMSCRYVPMSHFHRRERFVVGVLEG